MLKLTVFWVLIVLPVLIGIVSIIPDPVAPWAVAVIGSALSSALLWAFEEVVNPKSKFNRSAKNDRG